MKCLGIDYGKGKKTQRCFHNYDEFTGTSGNGGFDAYKKSLLWLIRKDAQGPRLCLQKPRRP